MTLKLSRDNLVAICPPPKLGTESRRVWDGYVAALTSPEAARLFAEFEVDTPRELCPALATMACETNLTVLWESGAYSAAGILRVFGVGKHSAAVTPSEAANIAALPLAQRTEALFERVYGLGNPKKARELGNTAPGDGWRFRGLGLNQLTGRWAHENAAKAIGCSLDELKQPINLVHAFLLEWERKDCNRYADDPVAIRKLINAGSLKVSVKKLNGLPEFMAALKRARAVITDDDFAAPPVVAMAGADSKPPTLAASTEMQASAVPAGVGGYSLYDGLAQAAAKSAAAGSLKPLQFALYVASEPGFWLGAALIASGVYLALKRRKRFHIFGV